MRGPEEKEETKREQENKKGERVEGELRPDLGGSYTTAIGNGTRVVHFASILRQIAAYLSDFCSRTKPRRLPLARGKRRDVYRRDAAP